MTKIKLEFTPPENIPVTYKGKTIFYVVPFLSLSAQALLINRYIADYFGTLETTMIDGSRFHYMEAECNLKGYILQLCTSLDVASLDGDKFYVDEDLWSQILPNISNYNSFRVTLANVISDIKQQKGFDLLFGDIVETYIPKLEELVKNLANIQPEQIEQAKNASLSLLEELKQSSVLNSIPNVVPDASTGSNAPVEKVIRHRRKK